MNSNSHSRPVTDVAVGVLLRPDGAFLLGQRPEGKPYSGYWEFPGGKIEKGESVDQALSRELKEELGIQIESSHPWKVMEYDYPHAYVRLHIHRIYAWQGEPHGCEGQQLAWQILENGSPAVEPLLPATLVILDWMKTAKVSKTAFD